MRKKKKVGKMWFVWKKKNENMYALILIQVLSPHIGSYYLSEYIKGFVFFYFLKNKKYVNMLCYCCEKSRQC